MNTLIESAAASTTRATKATAYELVTPSTTVSAPKTATATNSTEPTWRRTGRTASSADTITAPTPGAARNQP